MEDAGGGELYYKKGESAMAAKKRYIVRTYSAGVFFGEIAKRIGKEVTMKNARRLWYWDGAASLSQLAVEGTVAPHNCKFAMPVPEVIVTEAIEIIGVTTSAAKNLDGVPIWKR